ncbi:DUF3488 and transglutaminase-like domain-containing protein [Lysinibacter cavernae]|uniref:Transglutaminase-like domain-containing protein n=1 Tax=Lysinibacter cavernae TaxID=1640652 RepID=A0A7X5R107_9MICO|nr:transglutaminase domain-containing protein [Lysinibacter cavernae]NIH53606.1 hypothetical protein [Lysinibacter cavernae]
MSDAKKNRSALTRQPARDVVANSLFFVALMGVAAVTLWPVYQHPSVFIVVGVTLILGSALALVGALTRMPVWMLVIATLVLYLALGSGLAVPQYATAPFVPSIDGLRELLLGSALAWKQLLTVDAPVGEYQALLVPPFVIVLIGSVVGLSVLLRARRFAAAGVLAPVVLFVFGLVYGVANVRSPIAQISGHWWLVAQAFAFVVLVTVWMLWRARRRRSIATAVMASAEGAPKVAAQSSWPRIRSAIAAVVVLAVGGGLATGAVSIATPTQARDVLRDTVAPPFDPSDYASPLSSFRSYLADDRIDQTMFTVDGLPDGARIRIATLDTYDGILYRVGTPESPSGLTDFARVPYTIDQSDRDGDDINVTVTVDGYRGVWVPTAGWLKSIAFDGNRSAQLTNSFFYNRDGGTAAATSGLQNGDAYELSAVLNTELSDEELTKLKPGKAPLTLLDEVPAVLRTTVKDWSDDVEGEGAKLVAIADTLREGYISHGKPDEVYSRSGHALDRIVQFLDEPRLIGDAEQYAVTMSLLAQQVGFPSRVVFGFLPEDGSGVITGENVTAWTEVNTNEGWVAIDATPEWREIPEEEPQDPEKVSHPLSVPPPPPPENDDTAVPYLPDAEDNKDDDEAPEWLAILLAVLIVAGWVALVVFIVCLPFILIAAAKRWRRKKRRAAEQPLDRVTGAWREVVDVAVDNGAEPPGSRTRLEYADALGQPRVMGLARAADRAVFNTDPVDAEFAEHYWDEVTGLRKNWADDLSRRDRWKARYSLRSLGGTRFRSIRRRPRE